MDYLLDRFDATNSVVIFMQSIIHKWKIKGTRPFVAVVNRAEQKWHKRDDTLKLKEDGYREKDDG